jgi:hypothetical protein
MENPETTLGTQDTGRRQEKKENNTTPKRDISAKREAKKTKDS